MASPGIPGSQTPAGLDYLVREIADIKRQLRELGPSIAASFQPVITDLQNKQAQLDSQQATLASTVNSLAARVSQTATIASFNTGSLPNDSTFHAYGPGIPITIAVPTGRIVVSVGCGQATISAGSTSGGAVIAEATFSLSDGSVNLGDVYARGYVTSPNVGGSSLFVQQSFSVTPGNYTITGQMRAWAAGISDGSVQFSKPFLTVQVTG